MTADELAGAQVLARIDASLWVARGEPYRQEVRAWLRANGVDPDVVRVEDVHVVLLDGPAVRRVEYVVDEDGGKFIDPVTLEVAVRVVHSLCRVPLPEHLTDPP